MKDHVLNKKCFWSQGAFLFLHVYRYFQTILFIGAKAYLVNFGVCGQHTGYMSAGFIFIKYDGICMFALHISAYQSVAYFKSSFSSAAFY